MLPDCFRQAKHKYSGPSRPASALSSAGKRCGKRLEVRSRAHLRLLGGRDILQIEQKGCPEDGIGILVQLLADGGVQATPVVSSGQLEGIVTRSDLLAVLARQTVLAGIRGCAV
ncbi:MAG: CBS domain-containing protein [Pararhodobacter sp.]|nr:CBS domain-containing protein [Pararhodobacter sp.]